MSHSDEQWKMGIAEGLEELIRAVKGKQGLQEEGVCFVCYHDTNEHTPKGCFHFIGSEDSEYCNCQQSFPYPE